MHTRPVRQTNPFHFRVGAPEAVCGSIVSLTVLVPCRYDTAKTTIIANIVKMVANMEFEESMIVGDDSVYGRHNGSEPDKICRI
ncbi:MAG: hypothetical protein HY851_06780 [candidate division Zixibacteria bacterium]|nr:hypothetical protein [candidate division Zixibacteria bacterium]